MAYIERAEFIGILWLPFNKLDWHLIMAPVERWCSKTHTFHMAHKEVIVTFEDIKIQFWLAVDGDVMIGSTNEKWRNVYIELLGYASETNNNLKDSRLSLVWLFRTFGLWNVWRVVSIKPGSAYIKISFGTFLFVLNHYLLYKNT